MKEKPDRERSQVIRLGKGQASRLEELSKKFGTSQGQLVRWAVDALVAKVEAAGGKIALPFNLDLDNGVVLRDEPVTYHVKKGKDTPAP